MDTLSRVRLVIGAIGVAVWAWGYMAERASLRLYGIAILALALIIRFARPPQSRSDATE